MHEYWAIGIASGVPFLTILLGMFFNNQRFDRIEQKLHIIIGHDLREFYRSLGVLEGWVTEQGRSKA